MANYPTRDSDLSDLRAFDETFAFGPFVPYRDLLKRIFALAQDGVKYREFESDVVRLFGQKEPPHATFGIGKKDEGPSGG